jgi:hypothetical protein
MPMSWRRVIDSSAFVLAVCVAVWMLNDGSSWYVAVGCALVVFILTPFIVSRLLGTFILRRMERQAAELERRDR